VLGLIAVVRRGVQNALGNRLKQKLRKWAAQRPVERKRKKKESEWKERRVSSTSDRLSGDMYIAGRQDQLQRAIGACGVPGWACAMIYLCAPSLNNIAFDSLEQAKIMHVVVNIPE
jgi:hypothetical protein